ncbi:MAG: monovalent cation/H+ antiporter subunit D, partial [Burkholderiaceae bacterium]|nr:monovalent cation/H+ antiporter subunit D [Burkholderiaceae bacterium]
MEAWWSLHAVVLPVLLPLATAVTLLWLGDQGGLSAQGGGHASARVRLQRALSLGSVTLGLLLALGLVGRAADGALVVYELGDWPAPFGIVLVLD